MSLQERFNALYENLDLDALQHLDQVYYPRVTFADPVATHHGLTAVEHYFRKLLSGCDECTFEIHSQNFSEPNGFVSWTMTFQTPRLNGGAPIKVDGSSSLTIANDLVVYQQDYYDMGAMVYEQLPVLGSVVRFVRGRMAA